MRDGPLPAVSRVAGRSECFVMVAMVEINRATGTRGTLANPSVALELAAAAANLALIGLNIRDGLRLGRLRRRPQEQGPGLASRHP